MTVLVGCNGSGKTTLINNIEAQCNEEKIPFHKFDNLIDGGNSLFENLIYGYEEMPNDDFILASKMFSSSEGETIYMHIARQSQLYKEFLKTGYFKNNAYKIRSAFSDNQIEEIQDNRRFLLFDATDSSVSIDVIDEFKELFEYIIIEAKK